MTDAIVSSAREGINRLKYIINKKTHMRPDYWIPPAIAPILHQKPDGGSHKIAYTYNVNKCKIKKYFWIIANFYII